MANLAVLIMREIRTILWDSLKLLRARKLFWIVMGISLFVGWLYASIGFDSKGLTIFFGLFQIENEVLVQDSEFSKIFYLLLFTNFISPHWLGFIAVLLALVTSCSVYPELMREGSIETVVSKPVSRWKVFFAKYLGMLGFMALPLALFCLIVFLAMGLRVGVWKPDVFWAVPLLTFVFSILYSFAVLVGVWTRSTLFALLASMLLWGVCFLVHITESFSYAAGIRNPQAGITMDEGMTPRETGESVEPSEGFLTYYNNLRRATWILPKPRKSTLMLKEILVFDDELGELAGVSLTGLALGMPEEGIYRKAQADEAQRMGKAEILVPSALFQVISLGLAGWIFVRRDF